MAAVIERIAPDARDIYPHGGAFTASLRELGCPNTTYVVQSKPLYSGENSGSCALSATGVEARATR
jgi:hypothetical protein